MNSIAPVNSGTAAQSQAIGALATNSNPEKVKLYLKSLAGREWSQEDLAPVFAWADTNDPEKLTGILQDIQDLPLLRACYEHYRGTTTGEIFEYTFAPWELDEGRYFSSIQAQDQNGSGTIESNEPGYSAELDANHNGVVDLSDILSHQGNTDNARDFMDATESMRSQLYRALDNSYNLGQEGEAYLNLLNLMIDGDFPADVKFAARWLKADFQAHLAAAQGDFKGALAVYHQFADDNPGAQVSGELYEMLSSNENKLDFLQEYFSFFQEHGTSLVGEGQMGGVEFINAALTRGTIMNSENEVAKQFLALSTTSTAERAYFWTANGEDANISVLSATNIGQNGEFSFIIDHKADIIEINGRTFPLDDFEIRYDLQTNDWKVTISNADIYANCSTDTAIISSIVNGHNTEIAALTLTNAQGIQSNHAAPISDWYDSNLMPALAAGAPIAGYAVIAPDIDIGISFEALSANGNIYAPGLIKRFLANPQFVVDPNTERGQEIIAFIKENKNNVEAIEEFVYSNLTLQEQLRFFRMGDTFIGGGQGVFFHLEKMGFEVQNIEYTQEGDPCILRFTAVKNMPINELEGPMAEYFITHPEAAANYPDGVPVEVTFEIYSRTEDSANAVMAHIQNGDNTLYQTHAPKTFFTQGQHIAGQSESSNNKTGALFLDHCHAEGFVEDYLSVAGDGELYIAPTIDNKYSHVADVRIVLGEFMAAARGEDVEAAAASLYSRFAGVSERVAHNRIRNITPDSHTAVSHNADANNDSIPDILASAGANAQVVYNIVEDAYYITVPDQSGQVIVGRNNPYFEQLALLENVPLSTPQNTPIEQQAPVTLIAKSDAPQVKIEI